MNIEQMLLQRSDNKCELCGDNNGLAAYAVPPRDGDSADECILLCRSCREQIEGAVDIDPHHWRCLNDSMWSQVPAVQVMAWRMLTRLRSEGWPEDLLDMLYLDDETLSWAESGMDAEETEEESRQQHLDVNGTVLEVGDTVVLIKDLNVKGAGFTAKRGTAVRNISLVPDNPEHIEGRVNGQQIVILTKFVKKSG